MLMCVQKVLLFWCRQCFFIWQELICLVSRLCIRLRFSFRLFIQVIFWNDSLFRCLVEQLSIWYSVLLILNSCFFSDIRVMLIVENFMVLWNCVLLMVIWCCLWWLCFMIIEIRKVGMRVKVIGRYSSGLLKCCWDDLGMNMLRVISMVMKQVFRQLISVVLNMLVLVVVISSGRSMQMKVQGRCVRVMKLIIRVISRSIVLFIFVCFDRV